MASINNSQQLTDRSLNWQLVTRDYDGSTIGIIPDFVSAQFTQRVNELDDYAVEFLRNDPRSGLKNDQLLEFYRQDGQRDDRPQRRFTGRHRAGVCNTYLGETKNYLDESTSRGYSLLSIADDAVIAYRETTNQALKNTDSLEAMYQYVRENVGPLALDSNGRYVSNVVEELQIEPPSIGTVNYEGDNSNENLLETLQTVASFVLNETGEPILFDIEHVGGYQFRYSARRPTNRTKSGIDPNTGRNQFGNKPVVLSVDRGNISRLEISDDSRKSYNTIFAGGPGENTDQLVGVAQHFNANATPLSQRERYVNARQQDTIGQLRNEAKSWVETLAERRQYYAPLNRTLNSFVWYEFNLGDIVSLYDHKNGELVDVWITSMQVTIGRNGNSPIETIEVELTQI